MYYCIHHYIPLNVITSGGNISNGMYPQLVLNRDVFVFYLLSKTRTHHDLVQVVDTCH